VPDLGSRAEAGGAGAAGSAAEAGEALHVAVSWGYVDAGAASDALATLDRLRAVLWRLTHRARRARGPAAGRGAVGDGIRTRC